MCESYSKFSCSSFVLTCFLGLFCLSLLETFVQCGLVRDRREELCYTDVIDYWRDRSISFVHYYSPDPGATLFSQRGADRTMLGAAFSTSMLTDTSRCWIELLINNSDLDHRYINVCLFFIQIKQRGDSGKKKLFSQSASHCKHWTFSFTKLEQTWLFHRFVSFSVRLFSHGLRSVVLNVGRV